MQISFPNRNEQDTNEILEIENNVVIVGANGAGKSRMGVWIDQNNSNLTIHRISAHRALKIPENAPVKNLNSSENLFLFGNEQDQYANNQYKLGYKWNDQPAILLQQDYEQVLSVLFAKSTKRDEDYVNSCKANIDNIQLPIPNSVKEDLLDIWDDLLPHRTLKLEDYKVMVSSSNEYHGKEMSDGERVILYLLASCLSVPQNSLLIVDEPELHIHKSLMSKLWTQIEEKRTDCQFIYITHDLDFATSRTNAKKIWVSEYNGSNQWIWQEIPDKEEIPEELMLKILGSRKPILFVEGEKGKSLDLPIYETVYPEFTIIPRSNCSKVIEGTKAMQDNETLHTKKVYGLIDRDYRTQEEITALETAGINFLEVAEVENLFCVPEIVAIIADNQGLDVEETQKKVKEFIISQVQQHFEREVSFRSSLEINFKLNNFNQKVQGKEALKQEVQRHANSIDIDSIYEENRKLYQEIIDIKDVIKALKVYTNKGLSPQLAQFFNLHKDYSSLVLRLLKGSKKKEIVEALKKYLPTINPSPNEPT